jgi:hypothetical protein
MGWGAAVMRALLTAIVPVFLACSVSAQGKMPFYLSDEVIYHGRSFFVNFALYERETVENAPDTGLPQNVWIEESSLSVYARNAPDLDPDDRALALKVGKAFCKAYDLTVAKTPRDDWLSDGEWIFYDLCQKPGW